MISRAKKYVAVLLVFVVEISRSEDIIVIIKHR